MKPTLKLAETLTPDGGVMAIYEHDLEYSIRVNGLELMNSRQHESEQELARLGCANLIDCPGACVLIGGLGMGYTLRQALDMLGSDANVIVGELMPEVVNWNREYLGGLNGQALDDKRSELVTGDVFDIISQSTGKFDAILLDVDNGPTAMVASGNQRLYTAAGIQACRRALRKESCLAVWSTEPSKGFEKILLSCGFKVRRYRARNYEGSKSKPLYIWVAAENEATLPVGGSEPKKPVRVIPGKEREKTNSKFPVKKSGIKSKPGAYKPKAKNK